MIGAIVTVVILSGAFLAWSLLTSNADRANAVQARGETLERVFGVVHAFEEGLFLITPNRLGFGVIGSPLCGADRNTYDQAYRLVNLPLPQGAIMQCSLYAAPDLDEFLDRFETVRRDCRDPILRSMTEERAKFLRESVDAQVDSVSGVRLHDVRCVITVQVPIGDSTPTAQEMKRVLELRDSFQQTIKAMGMNVASLTPERYLRFMQVLLNHGPHASWRGATADHYDPTRLISHQILDADTCIDRERDGVWLGSHARVRTLSPKTMPKETYFGMAMKYVGDYLTGHRGIREPVLFTLNVFHPEQESLLTKKEADRLWTMSNRNSQLGRLSPEIGKRHDSLEIAKRAADDGDRLVRVYFGMAVFAPDNERSLSAAANATAYLKDLNFTLMTDEFICMEMFSQLLPFAADSDILSGLMRYSLSPARNAADLLPIMGAWRGTGTPLLSLISRDGQPMAVSPFDSSTNPNLIVVGESGAGKSFAVNELVASIRAAQGRVWIIDIGYSYHKLCRALGGEYVDLTPTSQMVINPFDRITNLNEDVGPLSQILEMMAAPKKGLDEFQRSGLTRVLSECAQRYEGRLTVDHIGDAFLAESDPRLRDIGAQLHSFRSGGIYGRFFNGPCNVNLDNPLMVLELQGLKHHPHLQRVVLMTLMFQIERVTYAKDKSQTKLLVVDECWQMLGDENEEGSGASMSSFLAGTTRTIRKNNGAVAFCSQSIGDFYVNKKAEVIVENCANKLLLKQSAESINAAERKGQMALGDFGVRMLRSVHKVQGEYSEMLCVTPSGMGVGRLVVNEFSRLLYSSAPEDTIPIQRYADQGLPIEEAIQRVMADRRRGNATLRLAS